jgi:hypothetical protein
MVLRPAREDPYVHFGDFVQLAHAHTGAVLVVDVADKVGEGGAALCEHRCSHVSTTSAHNSTRAAAPPLAC